MVNWALIHKTIAIVCAVIFTAMVSAVNFKF